MTDRTEEKRVDRPWQVEQVIAEMRAHASDLAALSDEDNHNAQVAAKQIEKWADRLLAALQPLPGQPVSEGCPTAANNVVTRVRVFVLEDDAQRLLMFREALFDADATFAESYHDAVEKFQPPYDVLSLDHDLGGDALVDSDLPNTGAAFCRWLRDASGDCRPLVLVHSYNPDGAQTMATTLHGKGYRAVKQPFGPSLLAFLKAAATGRSADAVRRR